MVASYIAGERATIARKAEAIRDSARKNHPKLYPPSWNIALKQQVITGTQVKVWVINLGGDAAGSNQVALYKNAQGEWLFPEGLKEEREEHRQAASRIASDKLGIRVQPESWQHQGEEVVKDTIVQSWIYYQEEPRQYEAQEMVRIGSQAKLKDSVATKWLELQRFYMILLAGSILENGRRVGTPFMDLLRTWFPHLMLAAKDEKTSGLGAINHMVK